MRGGVALYLEGFRILLREQLQSRVFLKRRTQIHQARSVRVLSSIHRLIRLGFGRGLLPLLLRSLPEMWPDRPHPGNQGRSCQPRRNAHGDIMRCRSGGELFHRSVGEMDLNLV